jgi:5-methylcytosine-specific restriction enzyme A
MEPGSLPHAGGDRSNPGGRYWEEMERIGVALAADGRHPPLMVGNRPRSPKWDSFRDHYLIGKVCVACGSKILLNAHHIKPYHLFPQFELVEENLCPLCEGPENCHFLCGHKATSWLVNTRNPIQAADRYARFLRWLKGNRS